jgi:hypothetical protein
MAKNRPRVEDEPGNPDGCVIGKKEAKTLTASVELLSDAFLSGAQTIRASLTLLSDTIFDMALKIEKVSSRFNRVLKKTPSTKKAKQEEAGSSSVLLPSRNEVEQLVGSIQIEQPKIIEANAFKLIRPAMTKLIDATESIGKVIGGGGGIETPNYRLLDASSKKVVKTNPRVEVQTNRKLLTLASMGTRPGSMYTHDIHCEKVLIQIAALLTQAEKTSKPKGSKPKSKGRKEKTDLDLQIDELRSKFPRLTKLFIDGPAKLKEEFKYWSGIMATGWGFASKTIKSGAKYTYKALKPKEKIPQVLSEFGDGIAMANRVLEDYWDLKVADEEKKPQQFKEKKQKFSVDALDDALNKLDALKKNLSGPSIDAIEDAAASFLSITDTFATAFDNEKKTKTKNQNQNKGKIIKSDPTDGGYDVIGEPKSESFKYPESKKPLEEAIPLTVFSELEKAVNDVKEMLGDAAATIATVEPEFKGIRAATREASIMLNKLADAGKKVESNPRKDRFEKQSKRKRMQYRASGGPATPSKDDAKGTDTVPAMLTPGEFVVNKDATKKNRGVLEQINNGGKTQKRSSGGPINYLAGGGVAGGGGGGGTAQMSGFMQALSGAGKGLGMLGAAGQMAVGAITGTVGAFSQITAFAGSFVQAFNPALMEQMNLVFKDLTAVIGMGLEPVIGAVIPIVRAFADKLVPVMQAMIPTVQLFADSMIQLAGPIIEILIQAFAALEPIIVMAAGIVEMWAGVLTWAVPLIAAVIKEVVYWFTKIVSTVQYVVGSLMIAIGKVLAMIPGTGNAGKDLQKVGENAIESSKKASKATDDYYNGTSKVQKAIQKPMVKGASVGAAAGKASFSGISDLGRNLMQSAMSSSTQASAIRTAENTQKTVEVLTKMDERMSRVPLPNPAAPARGARN